MRRKEKLKFFFSNKNRIAAGVLGMVLLAVLTVIFWEKEMSDTTQVKPPSVEFDRIHAMEEEQKVKKQKVTEQKEVEKREDAIVKERAEDTESDTQVEKSSSSENRGKEPHREAHHEAKAESSEESTPDKSDDTSGKKETEETGNGKDGFESELKSDSEPVVTVQIPIYEDDTVYWIKHIDTEEILWKGTSYREMETEMDRLDEAYFGGQSDLSPADWHWGSGGVNIIVGYESCTWPESEWEDSYWNGHPDVIVTDH